MDDFIWKNFYLGAGVAAGTLSMITLWVSGYWKRAILATLLTSIIATDIYWWSQVPDGSTGRGMPVGLST